MCRSSVVSKQIGDMSRHVPVSHLLMSSCFRFMPNVRDSLCVGIFNIVFKLNVNEVTLYHCVCVLSLVSYPSLLITGFVLGGCLESRMSLVGWQHAERVCIYVSPVFCVSPLVMACVLGGCLVSKMSPVCWQHVCTCVSPVFCVSPLVMACVLD